MNLLRWLVMHQALILVYVAVVVTIILVVK